MKSKIKTVLLWIIAIIIILVIALIIFFDVNVIVKNPVATMTIKGYGTGSPKLSDLGITN